MFELFNFEDFKVCSFDDLIKNPKTKYYYFIRHGKQLSRYIQETNALPIADKILTLLKDNPNFNLIFFNVSEPDTLNLLDILEDRLFDINLSQIHVINSNYKLDYYNGEIQTHTIKWLPKWIVSYFEKFDRKLPNKDVFYPNKELFFTCHNRNIKPHRYGILTLLKKHQMLEDTDWSLLRGYELKNNFTIDDIFSHYFKNVFKNKRFGEFKDELNYFSNVDVKKSIFEEDFIFDKVNVSYDDVFTKNIYKDSYVNIITETHFELPDVVHISEKSFIPFYFNQIPLFVASHHHIKYFRETYDFDLFDDLINHDYDDEVDNVTRMEMIESQLRILYKNKDYVKEFYKNNMNRFLENKRKTLNIINYLGDKSYFSGL
jgi:hypothetical protein